MKHQRILVLGGSGFIGSHVVARLAAEGRDVCVPSRRRERAKHLILLPTVDVVQADVHDDAALDGLMSGCDAVINLVGTLHGGQGKPYGPGFRRTHVDLPRRVAEACARRGVRRSLHMSALGADSAGPSMYLRSKGDGERAALANGASAVTAFRPSVAYGPGDHLLNVFARLQRLFPVIPLARAQARFQPIHVEDLAAAIVHTLDESETFGKVYEVGGPRVFTLAELVHVAGVASGHPRPILPMPDAMGRLQAHVMEWLPGEPLMTRDNFDSMTVDNVLQGPLAPELGITPRVLDEHATVYLTGHNPHASYNSYRTHAHR